MKLLLATFLLILSASMAWADTGCINFSADPNVYTAAAGESWIVQTTFENCSDEGYLFIGDSFGSDEIIFAEQDFTDPTFFLAPGASINTAFGTYTWTLGAPEGLVWTPDINASYGFVVEPCNGITIPCVHIGEPGMAWTSFTAYVEPVVTPVPEPGTLLLLGTGLVGLGARLRKKKSAIRAGRV